MFISPTTMTQPSELVFNIHAAPNTKYLSELFTELPKDCILNKVTTGCGLTSMALTSPERYIIAVPFRALIESKQSSNPHLRVWFGGRENKDDLTDAHTIMTTYDSLPRLLNSGLIDPMDYHLLVDEYHLLLNQSAFRFEAVQGVLDNYEQFRSYLFGSATPTPLSDALPELASIRQVNILWQSLEPVKVNYIQVLPPTNKGQGNTLAKVGAFRILETIKTSNIHVFVNSLNTIKHILKYIPVSLGVNIRVVCASSPRNIAKVKRFGKGRNKVSDVTSPVTTINFYTSTAFEGCDIFDETGKTLVITDGSIDYTKLDILTSLPQCLGRLRNSIYNSEVDLIYTSSKYFTTTKAEYADYLDETLKAKAFAVATYNHSLAAGMSGVDVMNAMLKQFQVDSFIIEETDDDGNLTGYSVNTLAKQAELAAWETMHSVYYINTSNGGVASGLSDGRAGQLLFKSAPAPTPVGLIKSDMGLKPSYEQLCIEWLQASVNSDERTDIAHLEPSIPTGFNRLGASQMKHLKYSKPAITKALTIESDLISISDKIAKLVGLRVDGFYPATNITDRFNNAYATLNLSQTFKPSDLKRFYAVKPERRYVKGIRERGYTVIGKKF